MFQSSVVTVLGQGSFAFFEARGKILLTSPCFWGIEVQLFKYRVRKVHNLASCTFELSSFFHLIDNLRGTPIKNESISRLVVQLFTSTHLFSMPWKFHMRISLMLVPHTENTYVFLPCHLDFELGKSKHQHDVIFNLMIHVSVGSFLYRLGQMGKVHRDVA